MLSGSNETVSYEKECSCCHQDPLSQKDNWGIIASFITSCPIVYGVWMCAWVGVCLWMCECVCVSYCVFVWVSCLSVFVCECECIVVCLLVCLCLRLSACLSLGSPFSNIEDGCLSCTFQAWVADRPGFSGGLGGGGCATPLSSSYRACSDSIDSRSPQISIHHGSRQVFRFQPSVLS